MYVLQTVMRLCDLKPLAYTDPQSGLGMRHVTGLARLPANCIMSVSALILKIAPRLSRGVHAKDENLGTRRPCAGTVQRLEGNVPYSAERGATEAFSFNGDLRFIKSPFWWLTRFITHRRTLSQQV